MGRVPGSFPQWEWDLVRYPVPLYSHHLSRPGNPKRAKDGCKVLVRLSLGLNLRFGWISQTVSQSVSQ